MIIGIPRETKTFENRVSLTPSGADSLVRDGHQVLIETGAGDGSGFADSDYGAVGAQVIEQAAAIWRQAELIVKVKEPQPAEWPLLRPEQVIFTYFHFAADKALTLAVCDSKAVAIAYETVQETDGSLPLLLPMSEVAGRMAVQEAAKYLERTFGGRGVLLSGIPGVRRARVMVLGAGVVGSNAAKLAAGLGADVALYDVNLPRLRHLSDVLPANVETLFSDPHIIRDHLARADVVIGSVLLPGKKAPKLVTLDDLKLIQKGAVLVDVAIDQGGCFESSHPTTHDAPTFVDAGVIHYCVTNMPGAVPRTATMGLTNSTLPYIRKIAKQGWRVACEHDPALRKGLNIVEGQLIHAGVAEAFGLPYITL